LAKVKNFKDVKETIAITKTPGHRKNRKVIDSLPLDWSIKVIWKNQMVWLCNKRCWETKQQFPNSKNTYSR